MIHATKLGLGRATVLMGGVLLTSCHDANDPGTEYAPQMYDSMPLEPLKQVVGEHGAMHPFNPMGIHERTPPQGAIPRGKLAYFTHIAPDDLASAEARLVNAVVRKLATDLAAPPPTLNVSPDELGSYFSHPAWLVRSWLAQFGPEATRAFLEWNQQPAPVYARWRVPVDTSSPPPFLRPTPWAQIYEIESWHWPEVESLLQAAAGRLNPQALPIEWVHRPTEPPPGSPVEAVEVVARCTFTAAHAGSPGRVHGGVAALALDEVTGVAVRAAGASGLTVHLEVSLKGAVPIVRPVEIRARYTRGEGRKAWSTGEIVVDGTPVVTAESLYVMERR